MECALNSSTAARRRYKQRVRIALTLYVVSVLTTALYVKHGSPQGWLLYTIALVPAAAVIATIALIGRYLQEETDEYQRMVTTRALLAGTAALLGVAVVSDFLRLFTPVGTLPPLSTYVIFMVTFGLAQYVQSVQDRGGDDQPSA